jgi:hypothetical protein
MTSGLALTGAKVGRIDLCSRLVAEQRGQVTDADLAALEKAGYGEAELIEVAANVA